MKKEFTLVELMVVIGIIAILAGILLPVLNKSRDKAIQTECAGNLGQLGKAEFAFSADNEQKFLGGEPEIATSSWVAGLYSYVKETKIFKCGADENDDVEDDFTANNGGKYAVSYLNNAGLWASKKRYLCERPSTVMLYAPRKHKDEDALSTWPLGIIYKDQSENLDTDKFDLERHTQVDNYAFVDGHTEAITPTAFRDSNKKTVTWEKRSWWGFGTPP